MLVEVEMCQALPSAFLTANDLVLRPSIEGFS
jgi:hypothetical protein